MQNLNQGAGEHTPMMNLNQTSKIKCTCDNGRFKTSFVIRKASALMTGNGKEMIIPVPVFVCEKCDEILLDSLPPQLKTVKDL